MRIVVEGTGDQNVETCVARFTRGGDQVRTRNCPELRTNEDRSALLGDSITPDVSPLSTNQVPRPGRERGEDNLVVLVRLLNTGDLQILQNHLNKVLRIVLRFRQRVNQSIAFIDGKNAMR